MVGTENQQLSRTGREPFSFPDLVLEFCSRTDPRYKEIRDRHYVENKGSIGQQIHFIVWYKKKIAGIISGGSSVWGTSGRDAFFGIDKANRKQFLNSIINNTVFRLVNNEKNLATQVMALWRRIVPHVWFDIYAAIPVGFETFVVEEDFRKGALYKADNWIYLGESAGSGKVHRGLNRAATRKKVGKKLIFAKKSDDFSWKVECDDPRYDPAGYRPSWERKTPEQKLIAKTKAARRKHLTGKVFYIYRLKTSSAVSFTDKKFVLG
jgi:hypothetical protein